MEKEHIVLTTTAQIAKKKYDDLSVTHNDEKGSTDTNTDNTNTTADANTNSNINITATDNSTETNVHIDTTATTETLSATNTETTNTNEPIAITQTKEQTQQFFSQLNFSNPSWDMFIVLFFVVASLLYGFSLGRDRIIVILVSIYMSLTVVHALPAFVLNVTLNGQYAFKITTFITVFVILFFLISRSALRRTLGANSNDGTWYQTMIFSILHVGLMISITLSFLPPQVLQKFAPLTQTIFTHEWPAFAWIAAPILAMMLFGRSKKEDE
ncbi:MAG: hypothetical protein HYV32_06020 [Candidatus Kerfeldbacteria bacterium]|nr:hypothetical protein [Candidatus Kerfeldbacteria bacterium]